MIVDYYNHKSDMSTQKPVYKHGDFVDFRYERILKRGKIIRITMVESVKKRFFRKSIREINIMYDIAIDKQHHIYSVTENNIISARLDPIIRVLQKI